MQKKNILNLIIVLLLLIGAGIGAELFFARTFTMKNEIVALSSEVETLKTKASQLATLAQVANTTGDEMDQLNSFFVPADGALGFVEYVERLATASGLTYKIELFDVQQDPVLKEQGRELLRTSIRTTGSMKNIRVFLSLIESLPYNVRVTRVDLRKASQASGQTVPLKDEWSMLIDFTVVKIMDK